MNRVAAVLSMLHEPAGQGNSATRMFRHAPVLWWTLARVAKANQIDSITVLCWDDQLDAIEPICEEQGANVSVHGPRTAMPELDTLTAARKWSDGWRGGLLSSCEFDRGFFGPWIEEVRQKTEADSVLLVDPSAALVDAELIDGLISHAIDKGDVELCFSPVAPGLSGVLLTGAMCEQLAKSRTHPGILLSYRPDQPRHDPISGNGCAPIPTPLARTTHRFTLDSSRQLNRVAEATAGLNGQLMETQAEGILAAFNAAAVADAMPREVVLELSTRRATKSIFAPATHLKIDRSSIDLDRIEPLLTELALADDMRLTLAGVGDPLLADRVFDVLDAAKNAGIHAIHVETDLVGVSPETIDRLSRGAVDVISVHMPAVNQQTYRAIMGVDAFAETFANLKALLEARKARGVPIVVPVFTKCRQNLSEMETWYDMWLKAVGTARIDGPSDYAGLIPDCGVADMSPPRRRPCARLESRLTILCDGRVVSCEQDVLGRQTVGEIGRNTIREIWSGPVAAMRRDHQCNAIAKHAACAVCKEWHRP